MFLIFRFKLLIYVIFEEFVYYLYLFMVHQQLQSNPKAIIVALKESKLIIIFFHLEDHHNKLLLL
jgi:hypothetical protein